MVDKVFVFARAQVVAINAVAVGGYPQTIVSVDAQARHSQHVLALYESGEARRAIVVGIDVCHTVLCGYIYASLIFCDVAHDVVRQRCTVVAIVAIVAYVARCQVYTIESVEMRAHPHCVALAVEVQSLDIGSRYTAVSAELLSIAVV